MRNFDTQLTKMRTQDGFVAALDQSGGSTPKALRLYGIPESAWNGEQEMFDIVHEMRTRIMTSLSFNGDRILAAILFEDTMDRQVEGRPTPEYLWEMKNIVPILKVDQGLAETSNGVQMMKPMIRLDELLKKARAARMFGTKMRSVIKMANEKGIQAIVDQQFEIGKHICRTGLVPIIEPEVDINSPEKEAAEAILERCIMSWLDQLEPVDNVMLKLTLPEVDNLYAKAIAHPNVVRVVALSGGYDRAEANARLARNNRMVASFSRALTEGLSVDMDDKTFNQALDDSIQSIFEASMT